MAIMIKSSLCMLAATATFGLPAMLSAQASTQKEALVISAFDNLSAPATRGVRADALAVSEALFGLGYNVRRLENPAAGVVDSAIDAADDAQLVVYYAGTSGTVVDLETRFSDAPSAPTFIFLDLCRGGTPDAVDPDADPIFAWTAPETIPADSFLAASVAPGTVCTDNAVSISERVIEGLDVPGLALDLAFAEDDPDAAPIWNRTTLGTTFVFRPPSSDMRLTSEHYALLDTLSPDAQAQMIALWTQAGIAVDQEGGGSVIAPQRVVQDTIVISAPVQPVRTAVAPIGSTVTTQVQDGVSLIAADPVRSVENRAVPGVGGLPTPSIIVGLIATEAAFGTAVEDGGALSGSELDYSNLEARRAMFEEDPVLFASLVETGAFDPPPSELVIALQTELTRMECYNRGIDGSWGPGSQGGLERYFEEASASPENLDPTIANFRQILTEDSVVCPPVAVAAPAPAPRRNTTATAPARSTATAPRRAAPAAPAPAAPAPSSGRTINRSTATGVFR